MTINLNTGSIQVQATQSTYPQTSGNAFKKEEYNDTTPSEMVVYPSEQRKIMVIEPNTLLVVTGYNITNATKVVFRKILRSSGVPAQGSNGCCPTITVGHTVRLHSVEIPCWVIDKCNPIFILKTPGSYEIDVVGNSADVVVTAMAFPMQPVNEFAMCACNEPSPPPVEPPPVEPPPVEPPSNPIDDQPPYCDPSNPAYDAELCSVWHDQRERGGVA